MYLVLAFPQCPGFLWPPFQLHQTEAHWGFSELILDASLKCPILMKKSFICHPVSRRQVWKEFSQVTKALGRVFAGGKCKAVRHAWRCSHWGWGWKRQAEEIKTKNKCFESQVEEGCRGATERGKVFDWKHIKNNSARKHKVPPGGKYVQLGEMLGTGR